MNFNGKQNVFVLYPNSSYSACKSSTNNEESINSNLYILFCISTHAVTIDLAQKVSLGENRKQLSFDPEDKSKSVKRRRDFTVRIKNMMNADFIMPFFATANDEIFTDVTPHSPYVYTHKASATSKSVNTAFKKYAWGDDYKEKIGNGKVEACAFVFDKIT